MHQLAQHRVRLQTPGVVAGPAGNGPTVSVEQAVAVLATVAAQLPRDRRGRPADLLGDTSDAHACRTQISDLDPLVLG
jgi:hypothetical protein